MIDEPRPCGDDPNHLIRAERCVITRIVLVLLLAGGIVAVGACETPQNRGVEKDVQQLNEAERDCVIALVKYIYEKALTTDDSSPCMSKEVRVSRSGAQRFDPPIDTVVTSLCPIEIPEREVKRRLDKQIETAYTDQIDRQENKAIRIMIKRYTISYTPPVGGLLGGGAGTNAQVLLIPLSVSIKDVEPRETKP